MTEYINKYHKKLTVGPIGTTSIILLRQLVAPPCMKQQIFTVIYSSAVRLYMDSTLNTLQTLRQPNIPIRVTILNYTREQ